MEPTARLEQVWARLDLVMDPELDEPVTDMGFIEAVAVDAAGGVDITFRLPTYWCSPNFAFLMAQGIRREVEALPWVSRARVALQDHMSADEMNRVVNAGGHFADVFNDVTSDKDLSDLREKFDLKAYQRRQEVVIKALVAHEMRVASVVAMTLADLQTIQLIEDALNAVRAAADEGVIAGGGVGLARAVPVLDGLADHLNGDQRKGVQLVQSVLTLPLARIAFNSGAEPNEVVGRVRDLSGNHGYNAATGVYQDLMLAGVIDPIRVTVAALANAGSVATLILTSETLVADLREDEDPTAARALGGGAELFGRK